MSLVSIICSTYNRKNFLELVSLPSILRQTYKEWELIIIDDASIDDTEIFIDKFLKTTEFKEKIFYFKFDKNKGYGATLNKGLEVSRGDYIALLDADDAWVSDKLEKQINFMERNNLMATTSLVFEVDIEKKKFLGITCVGLPGFIFRKDLIPFIYPIDENLRGIEDGDLFFKLHIAIMENKIPCNSFWIMNEPLVIYLRHSGASSFYEKSKMDKIYDRYKKITQKYKFLIEKKSRLTPTLMNMLYDNYLRLFLYAKALGYKEESQKCLREIKKLKSKNLLLFLISNLPNKTFVFLKLIYRNFWLEKIKYRLNLFRNLKYYKLYKKEIEEIINNY